MRRAELVELGFVTVISLGCWFASPMLPLELSLGHLFLSSSVLLLFQGLVRDCWILINAKRKPQHDKQRVGTCMCLESTVGVVGVMAGLILLGMGISYSMKMVPWRWSLFSFLTLILGFFMKDFVFEWNPWRIRREKDHINLVFIWKK